MDEASEFAWLRLCCSPGIGPVSIQRLLEHASISQLSEQLRNNEKPKALTDSQWQAFKSKSEKTASGCLFWKEQGAKRYVIHLGHPFYPPLLSGISDPPPILFVEGHPESLQSPQIAIVGSRDASIDGRQLAQEFATTLAQQGYTITSGLALGIDGIAHQAAIDAQGTTIAVLGSGLNRIYPSRHKGLASRVTQSGALVSEFYPDVQPKSGHFPRRNRIISGLSGGVLVIEAKRRSGSLITADFALEHGREVFAIPSSIYNPHGVGTNSLIKQGASLVSCPYQVVEEINRYFHGSFSSVKAEKRTQPQQIDTKEELPFSHLLANVGSKATPVDILAQRTNIPVQEVMKQLLELELAGKVVSVSGGYIIKRGRGEQ
ncbi:DNA-processing protein DprA [Vibrio sonorensis]|uniref:DNA-processing protein DprA n=1 Tax=Vibrio sonorensis TaxID=1004316 RepID=UPI0008DB04E2|nr:DNA-processing protein DprA [Vibrio sonorensis]